MVCMLAAPAAFPVRRYVTGMPELDKLYTRYALHTTDAQGEGGIEGTISNYTVNSPFDAHFPFSRFNATKAAARPSHVLKGARRRATPRKLAGCAN